MLLLALSAVLESAGLSLLAPLLLTIAEGEKGAGSGDLGIFSHIVRLLSSLPMHQQVQIIVASLSGAILAKNILGYLGQLLGTRLEYLAVRDMRVQIFNNYLASNYQFFLDRKQGHLVNDLFVESANVLQAIATLVMILKNATIVAALYVLLIFISWEATLVATGTFALLTLILQTLSIMSKRLGSLRQRLARELVAYGTEIILGIRQVKVFSAEERLRNRFANMAQGTTSVNLRLQAVTLVAQPLAEMVPVVVIGIFVVVIARTAFGTTGGVLIALMVTFLLVLARMLPLIGSLNRDLMRLKAETASVNLVMDLLAQPAVQDGRGPGRAFGGVREAIKFEDVKFYYPGTSGAEVLRGITVSFSKGKTTAIVGPSGAGKSTIVDLIIRLYEPTSGRITVDNEDLQELDVTSWRHSIGFVSQDTFIFNASIRDNIAFALPEATEEDILRAAKHADAHEFIQSLAEGYDTIVGDRGLKLSGGQRQRIAIARAILRNPPILIFDEATSSLDNESEQRVQQAINRISEDRTVVMIAHRLSTIVSADKIIILDGGRVVEEGTHSELISKGGLYWKLYSTDGLVREPNGTRETAEDFVPAMTGEPIDA
jgi:subfamily B ATP-binding cassette protein MsbA